ncbi:AraC family transcriptional regulator [Paenibacillus profundus]|uniref:AraC family transcriptional regulator n=1 Tax=Paenibacillus profundus TaxID=1173085 RepID=A0ABS8YMB7_9BACL|nr:MULTISPECIES: AraC family transcriptional regulator [Paenibacillus]MCE5172978.1 AraC family transcriptional regulator [Paenibacillus profundus]
MNVNEHIWLWNLASIHVLDVRHVMMELGEQLLSYRLPASAFLYATKGSAQVWLDDVVHMTEHFHVFHGGKGTCVDIAAGENFEYYLILYKAMVPVIGGRDIVQLLENERPFDIQYEFPPQYPLALYDSISLMNQEWKQGSALEQLHVRTLFLQFVYELLWQMDRHGITTVKPDLITQAIRYIHDKYPESLSLDSIAQALNYNVHYFSRKFKRQMGQSPIAYLIQVRMEHAQNLLLNTNATLQEIAERVGYTDLYYFIRIFKKHAGLSPGKYRDSMLNMKKVPERPFSRFRTPIVKRSPKRYSMDVCENHYRIARQSDRRFAGTWHTTGRD